MQNQGMIHQDKNMLLSTLYSCALLFFLEELTEKEQEAIKNLQSIDNFPLPSTTFKFLDFFLSWPFFLFFKPSTSNASKRLGKITIFRNRN